MPKEVKEFAIELGDAYSTGRYKGGWGPCIKMMRARGLDDEEIEAIVRSKWTRWASDASDKDDGQATSKDLAKFLDDDTNFGKQGFRASLHELVLETFPSRNKTMPIEDPETQKLADLKAQLEVLKMKVQELETEIAQTSKSTLKTDGLRRSCLR